MSKPLPELHFSLRHLTWINCLFTLLFSAAQMWATCQDYGEDTLRASDSALSYSRPYEQDVRGTGRSVVTVKSTFRQNTWCLAALFKRVFFP